MLRQSGASPCAAAFRGWSRSKRSSRPRRDPISAPRRSGARLTDPGRRCLAELEPAFLELRRAARAVGDWSQQTVTLSLSHSLAVGWLIPRIERFRADHLAIDLSLKTDRGARSVRGGEADLGICFSDVDLTGLEQRPLLEVVATPVASPALARTIAATGIAGQRLLSLSTPADLWQWWITETGLPAPGGQATRFELIHALYETASQGLGIALGASPTVWPFLESGKLERIGLPAARFPGGYRLVASGERKRRRAVAQTWRWLEAQAAATPHLS